jgi:hypothetical protein
MAAVTQVVAFTTALIDPHVTRLVIVVELLTTLVTGEKLVVVSLLALLLLMQVLALSVAIPMLTHQQWPATVVATLTSA